MDDELRNEIREKMRSPSNGDWGAADECADPPEWTKDFAVTTDDPINRPTHYTKGDIECIDAIMAASAGWPSWAAPLLGPVIKYVWRAFLKGKAGRDLAKADWYLTKARDELLRRGYTEE